MKEFSVLMSLYDKENGENLKASLHSVFNQTLKPTEVVLVLDGLTNVVLRDIVSDFEKKYPSLKVVPVKENQGLGRALKTGLEHCTYDLVARMDTDDICYSERFEKQMAFILENPEVSVLGTGLQEFHSVPGDIGQFKTPPANASKLTSFAKLRNPLNHPTVIFRKTDVLTVNSYQDMPLFEDYYLWVRLLQKGYKLTNIEEPLLHFRIGNDMIGRRHGISYLKKEYKFLSAIKQLGFINTKEYILSLMLKAPLRIMPKSMLRFFYAKFLR